MASSVPPVKGEAFSFETSLVSQADTDTFQASPTLAAGDVKVIKDGVYDDNIDSLPTAVTSCTHVITVALSATEMNADRVTVAFRDAAGSEWQDLTITIFTVSQTLDTTDTAVDDIVTTLGVAGAGLTALGDTRLANLDAAISTRSSHSAADVWSAGTRTLTSFGTLVADIWGYTTRTLTSLSTLVSSIAAAVWAYATRTLTSTAAATTEAVSGSTLTITNACTYSATLSGLTIPADWLDMWFTVKDDDSKTDAQAIIQIHKSNPRDAANDGLVYLNGAVGTKADGSLTVDQAAGTVAITIAASSTDDLDRLGGAGYDVKVQSTAAGVTLLTAGTCNIELTETKTID